MQILNELQCRRPRKNSDFRSQAVIKLKSIQAWRVEIIVDVMRQIGANDLDGKAEARGPLLRDGFKVFRGQPMVPRLLEDFRYRRLIVSGKRRCANGPESEDARLSPARHPLLRQAERGVTRPF